MSEDYWVAVIAQRARGVYLANVIESDSGNELWEAFGSLAAAKRWCAHQGGRKRLPWRDVTQPDHYGRWIAEITL